MDCCWLQVQRVEVARLLLSLASSSSLIRDELEHDAKNKKDLRRDLHDLRVKMKRHGFSWMHHIVHMWPGCSGGSTRAYR